MANQLNSKHDLRGESNTGALYADSRVVTLPANLLGQGIFDYLGKNRGTTSRSNPCFVASSTLEATAVNVSHTRAVRVWANSNVGSWTAWTDGSNTAGGTAVTLSDTVSIVYDFCPGFNSGSIIAGKTVSNTMLVKPYSLMLGCGTGIAGYFLGYKVEGSRDGFNWETIGTQTIANFTLATGWSYYALQPKRFYRFIKISGLGNASNSGLGQINSAYYGELEFSGKIKFLKTI